MKPDFLQALGGYVQFLKDHGQKEVLLSARARQGLKAFSNRKKRVMPVEIKNRNETEKTPESIMILSEGRKNQFSREEKIEKLVYLAERAAACQKCLHLASTRTQVVFGVGNPEAKLMFVGEAPGAEEDKQGEPFVGPAGQLLTRMILAMGLKREEIYIANVLKCRPDMPKGSTGNRKPTMEEMKTCLPYLMTQFEIIQPQVLVALGATAVEGLFGTSEKIGRLRGTFLDFRGIPVMPTYHPSYLLRNQAPSEKRKVWEDLLKVMEALELPISEKQKNYFLGGK
jgi:DNA polymerase